MFESITEGLSKAFRAVLGKARLSEDNVADAIREVRTALLEADVSLGVVDSFVGRVRERSIGMEVIPGIDPGQLFVKVVYDEMAALLGGHSAGVAWSAERPTVVMLCGLQGSGKTTTAGKLARKWKAGGRSPLLVAADVRRPAAISQLQVLGEQAGVPVFARPGGDPVAICRDAVAAAGFHSADTLILDTAGRLHVDAQLMDELEAVCKASAPAEILFVCDAMIGQSAVETAEEFKRRLPLTGAIMTKMDSDARGGGAMSLCESTGVPIKFVGGGEKLDDLEEFHPERMASRVLGMGDVLSLVEKAQAVVDEKAAQALRAKLAENRFDLNDFLEQIAALRRMGSLKSLLSLIPGLGSAHDIDLDESQFKRFEVIIQSMTRAERTNPEMIDNRRRARIAAGSGRSVSDVSALLKQFQEMRKITSRMGRLGVFSGAGQPLEAMSPGSLSALAGARSLYGSKKKGSKAQQKKKDRKREKKKKRRR